MSIRTVDNMQYKLDLKQFKSTHKLEIVKAVDHDWPEYLIEHHPWDGDDGPSEHVMGFKVYEFNAYDPNTETWCLGPDMMSTQENNMTVADAEIYLAGSIKWDGCANWDFGDHEVMQHYCGLGGAQNFLRLWEKLYEIAAREIPAWLED